MFQRELKGGPSVPTQLDDFSPPLLLSPGMGSHRSWAAALHASIHEQNHRHVGGDCKYKRWLQRVHTHTHTRKEYSPCRKNLCHFPSCTKAQRLAVTSATSTRSQIGTRPPMESMNKNLWTSRFHSLGINRRKPPTTTLHHLSGAGIAVWWRPACGGSFRG